MVDVYYCFDLKKHFKMLETILRVEGMMCQHSCAKTVQTALGKVSGVISAEVSYAEGRAVIRGSAALGDLINAVEVVGFEASEWEEDPCRSDIHAGMKLEESSEAQPDYTLYISNMVNSDICPKRVKDIIMSVDGVLDVQILFREKVAHVFGFADSEFLIEALLLENYNASIYDASSIGIQSKSEKMGDALSSGQSISISSPSSRFTSSSKSVEEFIFMSLKVSGMSCASCVKNLEDNLSKIRGVKGVRVSLLTQKVEIVAENENEGCRTIDSLEAIQKLGFTPTILSLNAVGSTPYKTLKFSILNSREGVSVEDIIEKLSAVEGVLQVEISIEKSIVKIKVSPDFGLSVDNASNSMNGPRDILDFLEAMGLDCDLHAHAHHLLEENTESGNDLTSWGRLFFFSLLFGLPITILHTLQIYYPELHKQLDSPMYNDNHVTIGQAIMMTLNIPMQFFVGYKYYYSAYHGALQGNFGMDCLVVTGTSITFFYSLLQIGFAYVTGIRARHVFFEATGMLLMFVTLGKYLEAYAKGKTISSIGSLMRMQPKHALLVTETEENIRNSDSIGLESTREIHSSLIQRSDILKILPGSRIPTDGYIVSGSSRVDESMITGESKPVSRQVNDFVYGSTINQEGLIYVCASSVGDDSAIAQIVRLVESAQMSKAPIQAYVDQVAKIFTPIIMFLSFTVFCVWSALAMTKQIPRWWYEDEFGSPFLFAMLFAISVIVISCPCALGLATPTAIMVGTSVAASNGILIKGGPAFEEAHRVTAIIFDKTGTLTEGKPSVTDEVVMGTKIKRSSRSNVEADSDSGLSSVNSTKNRIPDSSKDYLIRMAAIAEQGSNHPIARAILLAANDRKLVVEKIDESSFEQVAGSGISCESSEGKIVVGNRLFMDQHNVMTGQRVDTAMWDLEVQGKTAVCVAVDNDLIGIIGIADKPKRDAFSTLSALFSLGIDIWMVTGDSLTTAHAIADELEIPRERVIAGAMPNDKLQKVEELQEAGFSVAMIGDGINDSPALAKANLGVAIGAGAQVAVEAADFVLVKNNLHDIVVALDLSKRVFSQIKWNLAWALFYNVVAIPFAAGAAFPYTHVIIPPQYAGLSMAFSSIFVVLSSLSLKLYQKPPSHSHDVHSIDVSFPSSLQSAHADDADGIFDKAKKNINKIRDLLKMRIKEGMGISSDYSKLAMEDTDDGTLGLELGLGNVRGVGSVEDFDEQLNKLII